MNTRQSNLGLEDLRVANMYVAHRSKEAECRMSQGTVCHILQTIWKYNKIIYNFQE